MAFHLVAFCLFQLAPRFSPIWVNVCLLVAPHIVELGQDEQRNTECCQSKQNLVPCAVERFVFVAVNLFTSVWIPHCTVKQRRERTLLEMILDACTVILYIAVATVLVRTEPAFLDVTATIAA